MVLCALALAARERYNARVKRTTTKRPGPGAKARKEPAVTIEPRDFYHSHRGWKVLLEDFTGEDHTGSMFRILCPASVPANHREAHAAQLLKFLRSALDAGLDGRWPVQAVKG